MRAPLALALLLLAGCVTPPAAPDVGTKDAETPIADALPAVDAKEVLADVKAFSEAFPMRRGDNAAHNGARAALLATYEELGYTSFEDEFTAPISPSSTPTNLLGSNRLVNIVGIKWGATLPQEWIVVGAHYDVTDGAYYGAYDDASGTLIVQHLARAFADVSTARTIVFVNFDGEEQGLRGSRHMVEAMTNGEWALDNGTVVGMVDFDMAGIMHPAPPSLVADVRSPEMQAIIAAKAAELEIPEAKVEYRPVNGGSSDNGPFKAVDIPSVLLISAFDETSTPASELPVSYPFWHRADTYAGMVQLAGGEANLEAGFQNVVDIGIALLGGMATEMALTFE